MTDGRISVAVVSHVVTDEVAAMFARLKREAPVDNGTNPSPPTPSLKGRGSILRGMTSPVSCRAGRPRPAGGQLAMIAG